MSTEKNTYMEEVLQQQQVVAQELQKRKMPVASSRARMAPQQAVMLPDAVDDSRAIDVRITGWWRWKTVIVPPNVWVVHTRRGHKEPLHIGLGVSFAFNPYTDTFLVAPATMQTLAINARCIGRERQGILVQAYVQWIVEDFKAAYQKLDFSDPDDPMRIVNVQLREQSEASIKDKVATMSIDEVLADKRPIIEELTARLRSVAEGQGLKIVQVQIKEAVISSTRLWENLQKPFREEQARKARMAELDRERAVHNREIEVQTEAERAKITAQSDTEKLRRTQEVELAKSRAELEDARVKAETAQIEAQRKLDDAKATSRIASLTREVERQKLEHEALLARARGDLALEAERRKVENDVTPGRIEEILVRQLPTLIEKMPAPDKSDVVHISSDGRAPDGVVAVAGLVKALRSVVNGKET
jgi:flotillin